MSQVEFSTTVRGGFPVVVTAKINRAEPDVGIFEPWAELERVQVKRVSKGRVRYASADFLRLTDKEEAALCDEALDQ